MIPVEIPIQGNERIRDRVALILLNELNNQVVQFYNTKCEHINIFAERIIPVDRVEKDVISINTWKGEYSNKDVNYVEGEYKLVISFTTNSKSKGGIPGDTLAGKRLTELIGIVRYILEDDIYKTLLFGRPFIIHTEVSGFNINRFDETDAVTTAEGQLIFTARAGETNMPPDGKIVTGHLTQVKIDITDKGMQYVFELGGDPIPDDPRYVYIINKETREVLYILPGGSRFEVEVLQEILDTITENTITIIDPLTDE